jgi:hypothetical protein
MRTAFIDRRNRPFGQTPPQPDMLVPKTSPTRSSECETARGSRPDAPFQIVRPEVEQHRVGPLDRLQQHLPAPTLRDGNLPLHVPESGCQGPPQFAISGVRLIVVGHA